MLRTPVRWMLMSAFVLLATSAAAQEPVGCSWLTHAEADTVNVAFPDTSANYWVTRFTAIPGSRIVIRGRYPAARYFSFHVYDEAQRPSDGVADFELVPDVGETNPFATAGGAAPGGTYTALIEFSDVPDSGPAPNTLYTGKAGLADGTGQKINPTGFLIYRVYVADDPDDIQGDVPLPSLSIRLDDGTEIPLGPCEPPVPSTGDPVTQAVRESSFPDALPRPVGLMPDCSTFPVNRLCASNPPQFPKFFGLVGDRGGFYSNTHVSYVYAFLSRKHGDTVVIRARAPGFPDTRSGEPVRNATGEMTDLRFWSICQTEFYSQRFVDCTADHETAVDGDGYFTVVISDPENRPAKAVAGNDVTWLPYGGTNANGMVLYRHMLPDDDFGQAIQNVPQESDPADVMGPYLPLAVYCDPDVFDEGNEAAESFARCVSTAGQH